MKRFISGTAFLLFSALSVFGQVIKPEPAMGWDDFKAKMMADPEILAVVNETGLIIAGWNAEISKKGVLKSIELTWEGPLNKGLTNRITDSLHSVIWSTDKIKRRKSNLSFDFQLVLEQHSKHIDSIQTAALFDKMNMDSIENSLPVSDQSQYESEISESKAVFPGGSYELFDLLESHFTYPPKCQDQYITSYVRLRFRVDSYGNTSDFSVLEGSKTCPEFANEVIRILKLSERWIPATFNGNYISLWNEIPITLCFR